MDRKDPYRAASLLIQRLRANAAAHEVSGCVEIKMPGMFRSLKGFNYRIWAAGSAVSNAGTWMQRTAQDWLVLTELTRHSGAAVGFVTALQFGPQVLLLPWTGFAADHVDRRKLLFATQAAMGALAAALGLLTIVGSIQLWHVYVFAGLLGCVTALDAPARQSFLSELVCGPDLPNAVALNSISFNLGRLIGPALAGGLVIAVGSGWVFLLNAASFAAVIGALILLRSDDLLKVQRSLQGRKSLKDGFTYVWGRPDLIVILLMLFLIGTFALHFPVLISKMSVSVFSVNADAFGFLMSALAVGAVIGALFAARREQVGLGLLIAGGACLGAAFFISAVMPNYWSFGLALVLVGAAAQTFTTSTHSFVQLYTAPAMRGRVIAIQLAVTLGGAPIGAPLVGWIADQYGPRSALCAAASSCLAAALIGVRHLKGDRRRRLKASFKASGL